jgi:hypothetical protein
MEILLKIEPPRRQEHQGKTKKPFTAEAQRRRGTQRKTKAKWNQKF